MATLRAIAGPDMVVLRTPVQLHGEDLRTVGEFVVAAGETVAFTLTYVPSHLPLPGRSTPTTRWPHTEAYWRDGRAAAARRANGPRPSSAR